MREVVIGVGELKEGGHKAYYDEIKAAMDDMGLEADDIMAFISDHDGAIRKGMQMFDRPLLGCGCHALQLPLQHVFPLLRRKKQKKPEDPEEDDGEGSTDAGSEPFSDEDSEEPDSEWEDLADGAMDANDHQEKRFKLRKHTLGEEGQSNCEMV